MIEQEQKLFELADTLNAELKAKLLKAYEIAKITHMTQTRKLSGDPFIIHPLEVALGLFNKFHDESLLLAGMLHDVVEDCENFDIGIIYEEFGFEVGFLVDSVTKKLTCYYNNDELCFDDKVEKLIWGGMQNVKVFLLKIADRENNLNSLMGLKADKQIRMAFETQAIFLPLKRILNYDFVIDVEKAKHNFFDFLKTQNLSTPEEIKEYLLNDSFSNVSDEMFGLAYKDTSSMIWKIDDKKTFDKLCSSPYMDGRIAFINISADPHG